MTLATLLPKASGALVCDLAKNVTVSPAGVHRLARLVATRLKNKSLTLQVFNKHPLHPKADDPHACNEILVIDTLNFCFWSTSEDKHAKWTVSYNDQIYTGYHALLAAICRAKKEGIPITNPKFFSTISKDQLSFIMRSETHVSIPLLEERVACLHEVGSVLLQKYHGSFQTFIGKSNGSAKKLLSMIVEDFPCFRDEAEYQGYKVSLYKRAQILVGDIWACYRGNGIGQFLDINEITMFPDYRVPQVLVEFGVLVYNDKLMNTLKSGVILESGCAEEVEIRACSIHAVEMVTAELQRMAQAEEPALANIMYNSVMIDYFLWEFRQENAEALESIPYHKVMSIYY